MKNGDEAAPFAIRRASPGEAGRLLESARRAYSPYIAAIGREPAPMNADYQAHIDNGEAYVLEAEDGICGFVICYPEETAWHVDTIAVEPRFQGRGWGTALVEFAEKLALQGGFATVALYTNESMVDNIAYYKWLGYRETGRRLDRGYRRVFFEKPLGTGG